MKIPPWIYKVDAEYGFMPYDAEYKSEHYDVMVWGIEPIVQDLTLYKVPTVKMTIDPIDGDLTDEEISYNVTIEKYRKREDR